MARANNSEPTVHDLSAQLDALKADIGTITSTLSDMGRAKGEEIGNQAKSAAKAAQRKGEEAAEYATGKAHDAHDAANDFVRSQPATALGIAAGIGFLVGMMSSRR